jgi:hypothetical protein
MEYAAYVLPAKMVGPDVVYSVYVTQYIAQDASHWNAMIPDNALWLIHSHIINPGQPIPNSNPPKIAVDGFSVDDTTQHHGNDPNRPRFSAIAVDYKHLHYWTEGQKAGKCDKPATP